MIVVDAVATACGAGLVVYSLGWCMTMWVQRPMVVRHPIHKQWTAARSLRVEPPPTEMTDITRIRVIPPDERSRM